MKIKLDNFNALLSQTTSATSRGYSLIHRQVSDVGTSALEAGKYVRLSISEAIDQIEKDKTTSRAKELAQSAMARSQEYANHLIDIARKADANHKEVADGIETVSMGLGITAGVTAAGAAIAAPTGLSAVGVALGVTSAPLIVTAAPVIAAAATTVGVVSGGAYFYSKWRSHTAEGTEDNSTAET